MATIYFIPAIKDQVNITSVPVTLKQKGKITKVKLINLGSQSIGKVTPMMILKLLGLLPGLE